MSAKMIPSSGRQVSAVLLFNQFIIALVLPNGIEPARQV
jgi:hypothetical protein